MEDERGCGFRQWHGVYFVTGSFSAECDRGLIEIEPCSCCGERPRFNRGLSKINPFKLFGNHGKKVLNTKSGETTIEGCSDPEHCWVCFPPKNAYLDWVGKSNYSVQSFIKEAHEQGISRRYTSDALPVGFRIGESIIYLAMEKIIEKDISETIAEPKKRAKKIKTDAFFMAYKPTRIEKLFHITEFTTTHNKKAHISMSPKNAMNPLYVDETISYKATNLEETEFCGTCDAIEDILRKGITPVFIDPMNDKMHNKSKASRKSERKEKFNIPIPESESPRETMVSKPEPEKKKPLNQFFERKPEESLKDSEPLEEPLKEIPEPIETPLLDELGEKFGTSEEKVAFQEAKNEINKAIFESGETTISEQVQMDEMQKEYDSTHKKDSEDPKTKYPDAINYLDKKYSTNQETKPVDEEVVKIGELPQPQHKQRSDGVYEFVDDEPEPKKILGVHHVCPQHCPNYEKCKETQTHSSKDQHCNVCEEDKAAEPKELKTVKVKDPVDAYYNQEEDAMGLNNDFGENQIGGQ